jgi:3-hydroxyisobutyrate dehydrogenase
MRAMPETTKRPAGFVGLGDLGGEIARRILNSGWPLTVYARRSEVRDEFAAKRAVIAADLDELGRSSELLCVCVVDDAQVREVVVEGSLPSMREGSMVLIHSTIHPDTCRAIARKAADRGVAVVDAPISSSGGFDRSRRPFTAMVGGEAADFEAARPLLESFATTVRHVGPLGTGEVTKVVNNLMYYAQKALAVDAVAIARGSRQDVGATASTWTASSGASRALDQYIESGFAGLVPRSVGTLANSLAVIRKDLRLAQELAAAAGVDIKDAERLATHLVEMMEREGEPRP